MATKAWHSQSVKSLNKSPGRRRFVFKKFSERIEDIEIDVYRSLDPLKSEPSDGSSFLRDCLLHWRELNTAEDFISFYEEVMPFVQTLPQVLLHKETIMSKLISRLHMGARLSLEPILRLIAALCRDLLKDFLPFLQRITDAIVVLLQNGAEREPEIIEQIFTSWSYIMMYLQKYLVQDIASLLKITLRLRYHPKDYIQEFMAESISFLLRNGPVGQLIKGTRKVILEAVKKPSHVRESAVSALLLHVMRGTSSKFHSRANLVLRIVMDSSIIDVGDISTQGPGTAVEVVTATFRRLCDELYPKELSLIWECLFDEISAVGDGSLLHLNRLLSLLVSTIQFTNGGKILDYQPMLELVNLLIQKFIVRGDTMDSDNHLHDVVNKVLHLMLSILDGLLNSANASIIKSISSQWAPVFEAPIFEQQNQSLLSFTKELLLRDPCVSDAFQDHILSVLSRFVGASPSEEEVIYLIMLFMGKLEVNNQCSRPLAGSSEEKISRIHSFLQEYIDTAINDISSVHFNHSRLAVLWGLLRCYPLVFPIQANASLILNLVHALDRILETQTDKIVGVPRYTWQSLLGAALASYHKVLSILKSGPAETKTFLDLAQKHRSSPQVLLAVADFLDYVNGCLYQSNDAFELFHHELKAEKASKAVSAFSENLCLPDSNIRISTLRILSHYESFNRWWFTNEQPAKKKLKTNSCQPCFSEKNEDSSQPCDVDGYHYKVIDLLLSIETMPLSVSTSRKVVVLISKIQMGLSASRISEVYAPLLLNGLVGIFHKRFGHLWVPAQECLAVLINKYVGILWDKYADYLEQCQYEFLTSTNQLGTVKGLSNKSSDLVECFNEFVSSNSESTPSTTVLSLLLQLLQKVQNIAESRSRRLVPLFLKFMGYNDDFMSVESFNSHSCKGKEWRVVLREWLNLIKQMRDPKSLYQSQVLKEVLINRLLDDNDADIQMKVLDCLLIWKDDFLLPYGHHLKNFITSRNLREELATWTVSKDSNHVQEQHREFLIPLVIRVLIPKVRKLKTLSSWKNASIHHRRAVLCFLAQLGVNELPLFFELLIMHLRPISNGNRVSSNFLRPLSDGSTEECQAFSCMDYFAVDTVVGISWKKRYGFLHVTEDIIKSFDELHLRPFLSPLIGIVVRILESCTMALQSSQENDCSEVENMPSGDPNTHESLNSIPMTSTAIKHFKDQRSLCLKVISLVLNKFDDHDFGPAFWDIFFKSVKSLIDGFKEEGSSSERPSSLFSCFLAMSRSHELVSLLDREQNIVPSIFSILTMKTASDAIMICVLSFIENLLNLDNELGNKENLAIKGILLPNIGILISSLHSFFHHFQEARRKLIRCPGKTELRIFKLLPKYIKDPLAAEQFIDIVLPLLGQKVQDSETFHEGLHALQGIIPVLGSEATGKILNALAPLLTSAGLDARLSICDLLDVLAANDPSIFPLAKLIRELNATSPVEINEFDYDTRVSAYEKIEPKFFFTISENHALILLSHSVYDMSSEDLILRQSAYRLFLSFVHFCSLILDCEVENQQDMPESEVRVETNPFWTKTCIQNIIKKFFFKHMGEAMNKEITIQREWIALLQEMVLRLPVIPALKSLTDLCSKDAEVDFFNNILHLQKHRRARALARFRNVIATGDFSEVIVKKVFIPLFFKMLVDVQDGKSEHIRNACVDSLAAISGKMQWESYNTFLNRCFREMTLQQDKQKVLLRLICSVLDQFHFTEMSSNQELAGRCSDVENLYTTPNQELTDVQLQLTKKVLPRIQNLLNADSEKVNVMVSLAALKLLKLLPIDMMESQLPSIIHRISNFLKNRMESIRDEARSALAACLKELGLEYLQFIVKVLRATLKRGYELHVLGYTVNFLLSKALAEPVSGKVDYCLEELLSVVENDIFGDVGEEKEVEKIASKMKETRKLKSFETLKLVAQSITFKSHVVKLLSPIKSHLQKHLTTKMKAKLETMLSHIAAGIECNPSVDQGDLFVFVYGLIEDGVTEDTLKGNDASAAVPHKKLSNGGDRNGNSSGMASGNVSQHCHLITVFALGLLHVRLNKMNLDKRDEQLLSMLDPFVKLLGSCLSSKYEAVLSVALRCLAPMLRLPLPSLEMQADKIKILLMDIAERSGNATSPLVQACLKLLTALLRSTRITLSSDELHMLVQFPLFVDLERSPSFIALSLLKAIVGRKLVVPEIYDLATRVSELMVTSQTEPIRKKCSQILLQFLLDYKLSEKRLQQHLDFLLVNLGYEHSTGRESVLEMLHAIIVKFPKSILDKLVQTLFLHLVVRLANEPDNTVRSMVGSTIKLLIGRTGQHSLPPILEYSISWYISEKQNLWSAAAQVLGLLLEVLNKGFQKHINSLLPVVKKILRSCIEVVANAPQDDSEVTLPLWKEAYYSLVLLEKMLIHFPELYLERNLEDVWEAICEFLLYPHLWLRSISSRIVAHYFSAASEVCRESIEKTKIEKLLLMEPSRLFRIAVSFCSQLKTPLIDDAACTFITQNLGFALCSIHSLASQRKCLDPQEFWSSLDLKEQGHFLKAFQLLGSRKGRSILAFLTSSVKPEHDRDCVQDLPSLLVSPLLKKMGKLALQMEDIQMKIVLNCFRMISSQIGKDGCQLYAIEILVPLYKICEGFAGKVISDDVKQLAVEVRDTIQGILGVENFVKAYNEIRKNLKVKRDKRKQELKLMAVVNPMRNAKRKLKIAAKHKAHKKRKMMTMKMSRRW